MEIRVSEMEGSKNSLRVVSFVVFFFSFFLFMFFASKKLARCYGPRNISFS